jgi:hypothetical protein
MIHVCMIYVGLLNAVEGVRIMLLMIEFMHTKPSLILYVCYVLEILTGHLLLREIGNVRSIYLTNSLVEPSS